jgi:hypothetical protein
LQSIDWLRTTDVDDILEKGKRMTKILIKRKHIFNPKQKQNKNNHKQQNLSSTIFWQAKLSLSTTLELKK